MSLLVLALLACSSPASPPPPPIAPVSAAHLAVRCGASTGATLLLACGDRPDAVDEHLPELARIDEISACFAPVRAAGGEVHAIATVQVRGDAAHGFLWYGPATPVEVRNCVDRVVAQVEKALPRDALADYVVDFELRN